MKIAFTTNGNSIEDSIAPTFGRCLNFLIVDSDSGDILVVPNPGATSAGGAGVQAAEMLAGCGVGRLVTGSKFDVQFSDLNAKVGFGFAAFDNAQVRHAVHYGPLYLSFAK